MSQPQDPQDDLCPYGVCECDGTTCCHGRGPAAFHVVRDSTPLRVCTRCRLPSDTEQRLLVTTKDNLELWVAFDAMGAFHIACLLNEGGNMRQQEPTKDMKDIHQCVMCGRYVSPQRWHPREWAAVDTCGARCYARLLREQREGA